MARRIVKQKVCFGAGCKSTVGDPGVAFFEYPKKKPIYQQWVSMVGCKDTFGRVKGRLLCHKHFPPESLTRILKLKPNAAPILPAHNPATYKVVKSEVSDDNMTLEIPAAIRHENKMRCFAINCSSTVPDNGVTFFDLPTEQDVYVAWSILLGYDRNLERSPVKGVVCHKHFPIYMLESTFELKPQSVPTSPGPSDPHAIYQFKIRKEKSDKVKTYVNQKTKAGYSRTATDPTIDGEPDVKQSAQKNQSNDLQASMVVINVENEECEDVSNTLTVMDTKHVSVKLEELLALEEDVYKKFAINFRLSNHFGYKFLSSSLNLPSDNTLRKMFGYLKPLDSQALQLLNITKEYLPKNANLCTLCIEQVRVSKRLFYDIKRDEIIGFEEVFNEKVNIEAEVALVAMLRGISVPWTLPVSYCFLSSLNDYAAMDDFISVMIVKILSVGYSIRALVLPPTNEMFMFASTRNVTSSNCFIFPGIACMFDVRGLIMNVREILSLGNINVFDNIINWSHVHTIVINEKQHTNELRVAPKIKRKYLGPKKGHKLNFDEVSEIFSMEMVNAFKSYIKFNMFTENNATSALGTVDFFETIQKLIAFFVTNERSAMVESSINVFIPSERDLLEKSYKMFCSIKSDTDTAKFTFPMFAMTIKSFQEVFTTLKKQNISGKTQQFNLGPIQDLLHPFRKKRSCAALKFYFAKHWNMKIFAMPKRVQKRCDLRSVLEEVQSLPALSETAGVAGNPAALQGDLDYQFNIPDKEALVYIAAFLMFKCTMCHSSCETFSEFSPSIDLYKKYPDFKEINELKSFYNFLLVPPVEFLRYLYNLENEFCIRYEEAMRTSVAATLLEYLSQVPYIPPCACFPVQYVLKLFVRLRIYQELRFNNCHIANTHQIN